MHFYSKNYVGSLQNPILHFGWRNLINNSFYFTLKYPK